MGKKKGKTPQKSGANFPPVLSDCERSELSSVKIPPALILNQVLYEHNCTDFSTF